MKPSWFAIDEIPYSGMWDDDPFWLPQVLDNQKVVGEFSFDINDTLLTHEVSIVKELPHEQA